MQPKFLFRLLLSVGVIIAPAVPAQESLAEWGDELFYDGQTVLTAPLQWRSRSGKKRQVW
jgi:hypothetical protein